MFLLVCIPFIFGYLVAEKILRERQLWIRVALCYSLGLFLYLFAVNILFYLLPLKSAVYVTLTLMAAASFPMFLLKPPRTGSGNLETKEAAWLSFFCLTAFLVTLLWQMKYSDDDFFIHAPLMGLYLKDNFPPLNPFFPELAYRGHYGRDLTIASLSILFGGNFLSVQYFITALNQAAIVLLGYLVAKRYVRSRRQAMLGVLFVFLGVNGSKTGLLEVFKNNNSFVYLLLFLNIYLYFRALLRRDVASKVIAIVTFAVYGIVYETHYAILLMTIAAFPVCLCILRGRWRLRYFTITGSIVVVSFLMALVQGGIPTDFAKRHFLKSGEPKAVSEDIRGASQEVEVKFPRKGFHITSWTGEEYNLFSRRLLKEAGLFVAFLPLAACLMVFLKNYWGIMFSIASAIAILIPATVDFGRFNTESLRFLFFGGMSAAMLFGMSAGMVGDALSKLKWIDKRWLIVAVAMLTILLEKGVEKGVRVLADAAHYPEDFFLSPEEWACGIAAPQYGSRRDWICNSLDIATAKKLRPLVKKGDLILANLYGFSDEVARRSNAMVSAFSGAYVAGMGIKFSKGSAFVMGSSFVKQVGFRALAFWSTLDVDLLRELNVKYLYVNPDNLSRVLYEKLREEEDLELVYKESDPASFESREIYKIKERQTATHYSLPNDFRLRSIAVPEKLESERFYLIPILVSSVDPAFNGEAKVFYRILHQGKVVNLGDEIRQTLRLENTSNHGYKGWLYFSAPYEEGDYQLELYVLNKNEFRPLLTERGNTAIVQIRVT